MDVHAWWYQQPAPQAKYAACCARQSLSSARPTDHYFVPRESAGALAMVRHDKALITCFQAKFQLVADGVPERDVTVSGIPPTWHAFCRTHFVRGCGEVVVSVINRQVLVYDGCLTSQDNASVSSLALG